MKEMIGTVLALLRKYNRLWVVNLAMIGVLALCITALVTSMYELAACSSFLILLCAWEISDVCLFDKHERELVQLMDIKDKLVLMERKAERLQVELETTQAALNMATKDRKLGVKAGNTFIEATAPDAVDIQPRPKAKKSSSQRKPKPKQTGEVNENKN